jgi:hypothetical protein
VPVGAFPPKRTTRANHDRVRDGAAGRMADRARPPATWSPGPAASRDAPRPAALRHRLFRAAKGLLELAPFGWGRLTLTKLEHRVLLSRRERRHGADHAHQDGWRDQRPAGGSEASRAKHGQDLGGFIARTHSGFGPAMRISG